MVNTSDDHYIMMVEACEAASVAGMQRAKKRVA